MHQNIFTCDCVYLIFSSVGFTGNFCDTFFRHFSMTSSWIKKFFCTWNWLESTFLNLEIFQFFRLGALDTCYLRSSKRVTLCPFSTKHITYTSFAPSVSLMPSFHQTYHLSLFCTKRVTFHLFAWSASLMPFFRHRFPTLFRHSRW